VNLASFGSLSISYDERGHCHIHPAYLDEVRLLTCTCGWSDALKPTVTFELAEELARRHARTHNTLERARLSGIPVDSAPMNELDRAMLHRIRRPSCTHEEMSAARSSGQGSVLVRDCTACGLEIAENPEVLENAARRITYQNYTARVLASVSEHEATCAVCGENFDVQHDVINDVARHYVSEEGELRDAGLSLHHPERDVCKRSKLILVFDTSGKDTTNRLLVVEMPVFVRAGLA
jgi:hypothetical protein